jgi:hypothetical protein
MVRWGQRGTAEPHPGIVFDRAPIDDGGTGRAQASEAGAVALQVQGLLRMRPRRTATGERAAVC